MGNFDSSMLRALAVGPKGKSPVPGDPERVWTKEQAKLYKKSARLLYKVVMLRAAEIMASTGQDDERVADEKRQVEVHLAIRLLSKAADRAANGEHRKQHKTPSFGTLTDNHGIFVAVMCDKDGKTREADYVLAAIEEFAEAGLACPPPK
jgi:hypothetical protein